MLVITDVNLLTFTVWPFVNEKSGGYNKTGLFLALISLYEYYHRRPSLLDVLTPLKEKQESGRSHWLLGAIPLGSLIFTIHTFLGDPATLIAWT